MSEANQGNKAVPHSGMWNSFMSVDGFALILLAAAILSSLSIQFSTLTGLLLIVAVIIVKRGVMNWRPGWGLDMVMFAWLLWVPATLAWSLSPGLSIGRVGMLLIMPLSYLLWRNFSSRQNVSTMLIRLLWMLLVLMTLWGYQQGPETFTSKPQGPFIDPNTYAGVLNMLSLPLLADYLVADLAKMPRWNRTLKLSVFGVAALVFFLVASRGATLALLMVIAPLLWVARRQIAFNLKLILLGTVTATAYILATWVKQNEHQNVFLRLAGTVNEGDSSRIMLFKSAIAMIGDNPLLGAGFGSFQLLYPRYRMESETGTAGGWVHNDYLQLWQEAGIPMFILVLVILIWAGLKYFSFVRNSRVSGEGIVRLGYLGGILAVFIQAATNFMFYFPFIGLMLGLYIGRVYRDPALKIDIAMPRAWRISVVAYSAILGWLFAVQVVEDSLLDPTSYGSRLLTQAFPSTSRYKISYWLSVLAPFHPQPPRVMGLELSRLLSKINTSDPRRPEMLDEALDRMEISQQLAPCYVPLGTEALQMLIQYGSGESDRERARVQIKKNLACNPRHGPTYYYLGLLYKVAGDKRGAVDAWKLGLSNTTFFVDKLVLATATLSLTTPGHESSLSDLASQMASQTHYMETHPNQILDNQFWQHAQYKLWVANKAEYSRFMGQPSS